MTTSIIRIHPSRVGDIEQIFRILESAQDRETGKIMPTEHIHQWIEDARAVVKGKFADLATRSVVRNLASRLLGRTYMPAEEANRIVSAAFADPRRNSSPE
jgi:hypothetical protein